MDTAQPSFSVEGTYTPAIMNKGTILTLNLQSNLSLKSKNKNALVVLDISGSMEGEKLETSKKAISELITTLFQQDANPKFDLITFDDQPYFYPLQGKSEKECLQIVSEIKICGGTCFIPVFDMIESLINGNRPAHTTPQRRSWYGGSDEEKPTTTTQESGSVQHIAELAVVFLSDGQAESFDTLKPHIAKLKKVAEEKLASAEFHTLGMGSDHDARLLGEMTKAMPTEGTFQYVREAAEVTSSIDAISSCLTEKRFTSFATWGEGKTSEKKVNFISQDSKARKQGMEASWQATVCLTLSTEEFEKIQKDLKLNIKLGDQFMVLEIPTTFKKQEGKTAEIRQNFAFINDQLRGISDAIIEGGFEAKQAEEWRDTVAGFRVMLNEVTREIFKLKIDDRKLIIEAAKDLSDYMDKIGELLRASANQGLTNDQIASINAMAYRQVTKKAHLKTLDKRALQNVDLLNTVTQKAKEVAENLNEKEFTEKNDALIKEVGCCALNITNLPETLKAEDCLCLTFNIGRPEVAIQDASRIIIKQIYPTLICASAFLDSVKYSMNLNPNNSGGFDASFQGEIVKGASNEQITAALPLYLCNEHWGIAKEYIKPILGWDVTIDPLGYDYNQLRTVPFLLLQKALIEKKRNPNEFNTRVAGWILETCKRIIQDEIDLNAETNLAKTVKDTWARYLTDGTVRGVEVVQSNNIFLAYVYCLQEMGLIQAEDKEVTFKKLKYMIEEEMRRRQDKKSLWNGNAARKHVKSILQLDAEHYLEILRKTKAPEETKEEVQDNESFEAKQKRFQEAYSHAKENQPKLQAITNKVEREAKNKQKAEENKEQDKEKEKNFEFTVPEDFLAKDIDVISIFPGDFSSVTGVRKEYVNQAIQSYKGVVKSFKSWFELLNIDLQDLEKTESIGINNLVQLFALYIQNKIQHKNSDRLENFQAGTYFDSFIQQQADAYITKLARQTIYNAWKKELNSKPKDKNCSLKDVEFFIHTENLEAAAGLIVKGFNLGSFEALQNSLRKNPKACKKVFEKLLMLRHKEYNGVKFNIDFKPLKKFSRQLFVKYKDEYDYKAWRELWYVEKKKSGK